MTLSLVKTAISFASSCTTTICRNPSIQSLSRSFPQAMAISAIAIACIAIVGIAYQSMTPSREEERRAVPSRPRPIFELDTPLPDISGCRNVKELAERLRPGLLDEEGRNSIRLRIEDGKKPQEKQALRTRAIDKFKASLEKKILELGPKNPNEEIVFEIFDFTNNTQFLALNIDLPRRKPAAVVPNTWENCFRRFFTLLLLE
jgi:hypothetical protein